MGNLMKTFGLFFIFSAASASYNLYLNEHETMRLLGKLTIIAGQRKAISACPKPAFLEGDVSHR